MASFRTHITKAKDALKYGHKTSNDTLVLASERAKRYFKRLKPSLVERAYRAYQPDFELFQYSIEGFLLP